MEADNSDNNNENGSLAPSETYSSDKHDAISPPPRPKARRQSSNPILAAVAVNNARRGSGEFGALKKRNNNLQAIDEDKSQLSFEEDEEDDSEDSTGDQKDGAVGNKKISKRARISQATTDMRAKMRVMRRGSLLTLMYKGNRVRMPSKLDMIRDRLANTYLIEGKNVLLHGYLHIQIIRAKHLRSKGWACCGGGGLSCTYFSDASNPYVTVHAGHDRLLKTPAIPNTRNPEWNLNTFVPVCHPIEKLQFKIKGKDAISSVDLGKTVLSVDELIRFKEDDDNSNSGLNSGSGSMSDSGLSTTKKKGSGMMRTGVQKVVHLDNKPHHGTFEFFVEFIPKDLLHAPPEDRGLLTKESSISMVVPGIYFPLRQGNRVRLYINADDKGEKVGTPEVQYGRVPRKWMPQRYFRDVYRSLCQAEHMIYIVGWSVDYTISLLRGVEQLKGLHQRGDGTPSPYSSYIGELLMQKADEGVVVNMLVWDDMTSNAIKSEGVVATRDEELRSYFQGSKVNLRLVPMVGGDTNVFKQFRMSVYYTHHQKCVIADTPRRELVAYVGGVDLTYGRYEDGSYSLFRSLQTEHKEDFHNACAVVTQEAGPREPWHDIHSRVQGPGTLDLLQNFEERWIGQGGNPGDLVNIEQKGIRTSAAEGDEDDDEFTWNTQLLRSIDKRTAKLRIPDDEVVKLDEMQGVIIEPEKPVKVAKRKTFLQQILLKKLGRQSEHFFVGQQVENIEVARPLDYNREMRVDSSAHKGMVHHIRNARHSIYIESQYFLSSSFLWEDKTPKCCNLVAAEIAYKICEKIEAGERFAAYIVVPMWPEGLPESSSVQDILGYQADTMKAMYKLIQQSIDRRRKELESSGEEEASAFEDITPTDYLNFYCLANREIEEGGVDKSTGGLLNRTRRHLVYTHSKMTIVDDAVIMCGSANINQRSLDGNRDSELLLASWQPHYLATKESVPNGDVHGFRLHCFAHLMGVMEDEFREPSSLECVRLVNEIAMENWEKYTQDEVCEMTSYLVPFPISVDSDGDIWPVTENGNFPDTDSAILGSPGSLPKYLTT